MIPRIYSLTFCALWLLDDDQFLAYWIKAARKSENMLKTELQLIENKSKKGVDNSKTGVKFG